MKKLLIIPAVLALLAATSTALAQQRVVVPAGHDCPPQQVIVHSAPCAPQQVIVHSAPCPAPAPPCYQEVTCKTCVPAPGRRTVTKTSYECKSVDFCLPKCGKPCFRGLFHRKRCCADGSCSSCGAPAGCGHSSGCRHGCDDGCDKGSCASCESKARCRKVLVKKITTRQEDFIDCKVEETKKLVAVKAPCGHGAPAHCAPVHSVPVHCAPAAPAAIEVLPPPAAK